LWQLNQPEQTPPDPKATKAPWHGNMGFVFKKQHHPRNINIIQNMWPPGEKSTK